MYLLSQILQDNRFTQKDLTDLEGKLFHEGDRRRPYLVRFIVFLFLSTIIATYGVLADSTATVIGAMIIAPLMTPIVATTAALVMGDALAVALLEARGFTAEEFALSHPGGSLGRRLLLRVQDVMHHGDALPRVALGSPLRDALLEITRQGMGFTCVIDDDDHLVGVYTDGDLRRTLDQHGDLRALKVDDVMTRGGKTVRASMLAAEAVRIMEENRIRVLVVCDEDEHPIGAIHMHGLLASGVI